MDIGEDVVRRWFAPLRMNECEVAAERIGALVDLYGEEHAEELVLGNPGGAKAKARGPREVGGKAGKQG